MIIVRYWRQYSRGINLRFLIFVVVESESVSESQLRIVPANRLPPGKRFASKFA